jgi:hypothetical protein
VLPVPAQQGGSFAFTLIMILRTGVHGHSHCFHRTHMGVPDMDCEGPCAAHNRDVAQQRMHCSNRTNAAVTGTNHLLPQCRYGQGCKYSHDLQAYMASKPPDLPGPCPYSKQSQCPYHATCR